MPAAPLPNDEPSRLEALRALNVLDSPAEPEFDALVRAAALVCGAPMSLLSLVDAGRQWFKAGVGLPGVSETPRDVSFCAHAIAQDGIFEIPDATKDARFADNPLVTEAPFIRFYAGAPLRLSNGAAVGALCVVGPEPQRLDTEQRELLRLLSQAATRALEGRRALAERAGMIAALAQSETFLTRIGELAGVGGWEVDLQTGRLYWSPQFCRLIGVPADYRPRLREATDIYAPQARAKVRAAADRAIADGTDWDLELPVVRRDGRAIWVRLVGHAEFVAGRAVRLVGALQDVTEQVGQRRRIECANERLALATGSGRIGIWEIDAASGTVTMDGWGARAYGEPAAGLTLSLDAWRRRVHPEDRGQVMRAGQEALAGVAPMDIEFRIIWADGSIHHQRAAASAPLPDDGAPKRLIGVNWDMTPLRRLGAELAEQHELLRVTLESIGDGVLTTDAAGHVTWLNPVAERLTGWPVEEARGRPLVEVFQVIDERTRAPAADPVAACLAGTGGNTANGDALLVSRQGTEFGIADSAAPIRNATGALLGAVLVFHDVTEQRRLAGEMSHRARHDALTGLVNRAEFDARLARTLQKAHDDGSEHALLYIDLDQFKLVNDACGHTVGDQLLEKVARLLADTVRASDTLARLGGDEFAVILEHCPGERAQRVALSICERMDDFRFAHDGRRFRIGASVGLVPVDRRWSTPVAAMQAADTSCYAAKEAGRNRVHAWFDTDLAMHARSGEARWATRLEQALDEERFVLFAQRIEAIRPGRAAGQRGVHAEALLRLVDTDGSLVAPGAFLPAAERFHLASRIDRWVLRSAGRWLLAQRELAAIETLCINLSGQSIGDRAFHRHALDILTDVGPAVCRRLCLEITETSAVTNLADAAAFIADARRLGVRVALDDFGAGTSSFGYLKTLPVDILKIDGQFVRDMLADPLNDVAVRCFVEVARVMKLETVAEFVDRPEVLARLGEIGVDYAQGFLLHRPEPIDKLLAAPAVRPTGAAAP